MLNDFLTTQKTAPPPIPAMGYGDDDRNSLVPHLYFSSLCANPTVSENF